MGVVFHTHSLSQRSFLWPLEESWQWQFRLINVCLQGPLRGRCECQVSSVAFYGCIFLVGELNLRQSHLLPSGESRLSPQRMAVSRGLFSVPYFFSNWNLSPAQETLGLELRGRVSGTSCRCLSMPLSPFSETLPARDHSPDCDVGFLSAEPPHFACSGSLLGLSAYLQ